MVFEDSGFKEFDGLLDDRRQGVDSGDLVSFDDGMASLKLEDGESRNLTDSWIDLDDLDRFRTLTLGSVICLIMRMSMEISS